MQNFWPITDRLQVKCHFLRMRSSCHARAREKLKWKQMKGSIHSQVTRTLILNIYTICICWVFECVLCSRRCVCLFPVRVCVPGCVNLLRYFRERDWFGVNASHLVVTCILQSVVLSLKWITHQWSTGSPENTWKNCDSTADNILFRHREWMHCSYRRTSLK